MKSNENTSNTEMVTKGLASWMRTCMRNIETSRVGGTKVGFLNEGAHSKSPHFESVYDDFCEIFCARGLRSSH